MRTITLPSPAKLNLWLYVTGRRDDGFHNLESLFAKIHLADELAVRVRPLDPEAGIGPPLRLQCDRPEVPVDASNLIDIALRRFRERFGSELPPLDVRLAKRIPMGGGLAGGSSNAAAMLRAMAAMVERDVDPDALHAFAQDVGSDVPFFLGGPQAMVTGRGESLERVEPWPFEAVLLCPPFSCDTAKVYKRFAAGARDALPSHRLSPSVLWNGSTPVKPTDVAPRLVNMLRKAAESVQPELQAAADFARRLVDRPVHLTGSGSTLFVLADSKDDAAELAMKLSGMVDFGCRVIATSGVVKTQLEPMVTDD